MCCHEEMRILHINFSDHEGGAARSCMRLHYELLRNGIDSSVFVYNRKTNTPNVFSNETIFDKFYSKIAPHVANIFRFNFKTQNQALHSLGIMPSRLLKKINKSDYDIIHIHWIGSEMLSIRDVSKIKKKIVWTFHDMWAFCGAEHITSDDRWVDGYNSSNRDSSEIGFDLNKFIWSLKKKYWLAPFNIITPSSWMEKNVKKSNLFSKWPRVKKIYNVFDPSVWKPFDYDAARALFGFNHNKQYILIASMGISKDFNKGFDLLIESLGKISVINSKKIELVTLGHVEQETREKCPITINSLDRFFDDVSMKALFSAVDVLVLPSRIENLPNVLIEAGFCGLPSVAFKIGGLQDIVNHLENGYLAESYNTQDFANGIDWCLSEKISRNFMYKNFQKRFEIAHTVNEHIDFYKNVLSD